MTRNIEIWKDPYGECYSTTKSRNIEFEPGLTVLDSKDRKIERYEEYEFCAKNVKQKKKE